MKGKLTALGRHVAEREFASRTGDAFPLSHFYARSDEALTKLLWSFRLDNITMYLPALISAAAIIVTIWMVHRRARHWRALRLALLALTTLDLLAFAWRYNPVIPARTFYPTPGVASRIMQDPSLFRFSATELDLFPDAQMMYGLADLRSIDFSTQWFSAYVAMIPETVLWLPYGTTFASFKSPLLQVLNLKYVFSTSSESPAGSAAADAVLSTDVARLWRLRTVQPRSFVVSEALVAHDDSEAVRSLRAAPDAVYHRVVLSAPAPPARPAPGTAGHAAPASPAEVTELHYGAEESVWRVRSAGPAYLVTTDAYYPGWRAYVDGVRSTIYRANVAFRAIEIPAGVHRVVYRYEPTWLPLAVILEILSALVIASGLVWSAIRSRGITQGAPANTAEVGGGT
jgi:membrane protein YfhO